MKYYLAVDIGASSGRHIVGWLEDGQIRTEEVYRFPNGVTEQDGHLTWEIEALEKHVRAGIDEALSFLFYSYHLIPIFISFLLSTANILCHE